MLHERSQLPPLALTSEESSVLSEATFKTKNTGGPSKTSSRTSVPLNETRTRVGRQTMPSTSSPGVDEEIAALLGEGNEVELRKRYK